MYQYVKSTLQFTPKTIKCKLHYTNFKNYNVNILEIKQQKEKYKCYYQEEF